MQSDAQSRSALISTYISERLLDAETLSQVPSVQTFIAANPTTPGYRDLATHAAYALGAGSFRDKHYTTWTLFTPSGKPVLSYPLAPQKHGQWIVPPTDLQQILAHKTFVSSVYYNPTTQKASLDIYSPVVDTQNGTNALLGFMRATLNLDYIWSLVQQDKNNNGDGSYAFILDENGVRIADTLSSQLFTSIAPLSSSVQQSISNENRYGTSSNVPVLADAALAHNLHTTTASDTFEIQPTDQHDQRRSLDLRCA